MYILLLRSTHEPSSAATSLSGGHTWDPNQDDHAVARELSSSNGYSQSNSVAQMIVRHFASGSRHFSVIKLGLIIGTPTEVVANVDDYIWRVVAAAIDIQPCNVNCEQVWLTVTSSARVAEETIRISRYLNSGHYFGISSSICWSRYLMTM
ncbi:hypothetical protein BBP40_004851 [Aspergillus hancockii]|nr:hypothetical protein BBP40_004851 [Aspergillus hancockii]